SADSSVPVIAIIGAGPVGLACAYHLAAVGFACEVFEGESECWGGLADLAEEVMPRRILDEELEFLKNMGVFVNLNREVDDDAFSEIRREFQAVIVAVGAAEGLTGGSFFGLNTTEQGIYVDSADFATSAENVYAVGDCVIPLRKAVQSVADAKLLADRLTTALGDTHSDETKDDCWSRSENAFNSRFGKLFPGDLDEFMRFASEPGRTPPSDPSGNYLRDDAVSEAERCLRCDCVSADDCALRQVADEFGAERLHRASRRKDERRKFTRIFDGDIVFEPGKCVKCGRCVAICVKCAEKLGAAFINRGLEMEIAFPPGVSPKEGLGGAAVECAAACPTGAIVILR
ncbi:MAG: FAD-dependent oxidoreductase, partial [Victivallales bacterium]|nr:FAD-dependent oxidoreductase [Victivallales bacterium]